MAGGSNGKGTWESDQPPNGIDIDVRIKQKWASVLVEMRPKFTCCLAVIGRCQAVITWANGTTWATSFFFSSLLPTDVQGGCRLGIVSLVGLGLAGGATAADAQDADGRHVRPRNVCGFKMAGA